MPTPELAIVNTTDPAAAVRHALPELRNADLPLEATAGDGRLRRFRLDRRDSKRSGWIVTRRLRAGGLWVAAGSWRSGASIRLLTGLEGTSRSRQLLALAEARDAAHLAEREANERAREAAERARRLIARSILTTDWSGHEWAQVKRLSTPLRRLPCRGPIVVPIQDSTGAIISAQLIASDGARRFLAGSRVHGGWAWIGPAPDPKYNGTIAIVEGVATADSVRRALQCPVAAALSATNIQPAATNIRRNWPLARIVIAADNDWRVDSTGIVVNPGVDAALAAAQSIGADLAIPPRPGTDWWDVEQEFGVALTAQILATTIPVRQTGHAERPSAARELELHRDKHGRIIRDPRNVASWLATQIDVVYDGFSDKIAVGASTDRVVSILQSRLYRDYPDVSWRATDVQEGLELAVADGTITRRDLLREALDRIPTAAARDANLWVEAARDGFELESDYDLQLAAAAIRVLFLGAVSRILEPGAKVDHVLVLVGPQGAKKSWFCKAIALDERWYSDSIDLHQLGDKDTSLGLQGVHIVEIPELVGFSRGEMTKIKSWLTQTADRYRPPYGRETVTRPRRFVAIATTNEFTFLRDVEHRRFLVLRLRAVNIEWWLEHRDCLYATARAEFARGEQPVIGNEVFESLTEEHRRAETDDPWNERLRDILEKRTMITVSECLDILGVPVERRTIADSTRVGIMLSRLGLVRIRGPRPTRQWMWVRRSTRATHDDGATS